MGEDNTVSVGRSHGYASPEHYGIDFSGSSGNETNTLRNRIFTRRKKEDMSPADSVTNSSLNGTTSSSRVITTSDGKTIKLDKRSDIYGVGATLYHLLTGIRPEKADHTDQIEPITNFAVNEMIAKIVQKAMDPNPDRRYQTAEEMLYALEHIRDGDRQTKSHRCHILETAVLIAVLLMCGAGMTFIGQQQKQRVSYYKECVTDSVEALRMGDKKTVLKLALLTFPENPGLYDPPEPLPEAELALSNALGIYDLQSSYKPWRTISLSSEPMKLRMSPDCTKIAFQVRESDAQYFIHHLLQPDNVCYVRSLYRNGRSQGTLSGQHGRHSILSYKLVADGKNRYEHEDF